MKQFVFAAVSVFVPLIAIDAVWLALSAKRFYAAHIGHLMTGTPKLWVAGIFYVIYACGIALFVVVPALHSHQTLFKTFLYGAFLGFVAYGAYDFTNHATLKDWPAVVTAVDLVWGSALTASASAIALVIMRQFS